MIKDTIKNVKASTEYANWDVEEKHPWWKVPPDVFSLAIRTTELIRRKARQVKRDAEQNFKRSFRYRVLGIPRNDPKRESGAHNALYTD